MDLAVLGLLLHRWRRDSFQRGSHDDPYRCVTRVFPVGPYLVTLIYLLEQTLTRALRYSSKAFFYAQGVTIVGEMLAPPLGAYLMRTSLWVPIIIGFVCLLIAVALTVVMPETRFTALARDSRHDEEVYHGPGPSDSEENSESQGSESETDIKSRFEAAVEHTSSTVGFVLKHRNLVLLMTCFFSTDFAQQSLAILLRYVSARYSIPLAKVFLLFTLLNLFSHCVHKKVASATLFVTMTILTRVPIDF